MWKKKKICGGLAMKYCLLEAIFIRGKLWKILFAPFVDVNRKQSYISYGRYFGYGCLECEFQKITKEVFHGF
jgi:hypothetical protein